MSGTRRRAESRSVDDATVHRSGVAEPAAITPLFRAFTPYGAATPHARPGTGGHVGSEEAAGMPCPTG